MASIVTNMTSDALRSFRTASRPLTVFTVVILSRWSTLPRQTKGLICQTFTVEYHLRQLTFGRIESGVPEPGPYQVEGLDTSGSVAFLGLRGHTTLDL
jgi:hypothetical protein